MRAIRLVVGAGHYLSLGLKVISEVESKVGAAYPVGIGNTGPLLRRGECGIVAQSSIRGNRAELAIAVEDADLRLLPQLAGDAAHGKVSALAPQRVIIGDAAARPAVIHRQQ